MTSKSGIPETVPASVFEHTDHLAYLREILGRGKSLAVTARRLGYQSPRTVGMVLVGKRLPSTQFIEQFGRLYGLTDIEQEYLALLVRKAARPSPLVLKKIDAHQARYRLDTRSYDSFSFAEIKDWYFLPIFEYLKSQPPAEDWLGDWPSSSTAAGRRISRHFEGRITLAQAQNAIVTFAKVGILVCGADDVWRIPDRRPFYTGTDLPSQAIRDHHRQMLKQADSSLDTAPILQREFVGLTLRMRPGELGEAKKMIRAFRNQFNSRFGNSESTSIFQLNLQLFPHSVLNAPSPLPTSESS